MTAALPESPQHDGLRAHLLDLYARIVSVPIPPDQLIGRFFRLRKQLPPGARGFLAATVYALLRRRIRTLLLYQWAARKKPMFAWDDHCAMPDLTTPVEEAALALYRWMVEDLGAKPRKAAKLTHAALDLHAAQTLPKGEFPPPPFGNPSSRLKEFSVRWTLGQGMMHAPEDVRAAHRHSLPGPLIVRWTERFGAERAEALCASLGEPAPLDLRVNRLKGSRDECLAQLQEAGHKCEATALSVDGVRMLKKENIFRSPLFDDGWFEVQDEASQLVGFALDPHPNWRVLDACSGGGGKSLHLAALMKNKGEVFAHDIDPERLDPQKKRLRRAGVHNVRLIQPGKAVEHAPYDAVLIDAPCLGLGTLRRNPDLAWRGPLERRLAEVTAVQRECVALYSKLLKPGGVLLYATCSFEPEETTAIVDAAMEATPSLVPDPIGLRLEHHGISGAATNGDFALTLLPSEHRTDGFYIARFRKQRPA